MLTPIEQTPSLVFEPARQQYTPSHPIPTPTPPAPAVQVVAPTNTASSKDSAPQDGSANQGSSQQHSKAWAEASQKLGAAWGYLQELKSQASAAMSNGDTHAAQQIANEAASVAASIRDIAGTVSIPSGTVTPSQSQQDPKVLGTAGGPTEGKVLGTAGGANEGAILGSAGGPNDGKTLGSAGGPSDGKVLGSAGGPSDAGTVIDTARAGLGVAKDIVDQAAQMIYFSSTDRSAVDANSQAVMDAMAAVEALAVTTPAVQASAAAATVASQPHIDIKA